MRRRGNLYALDMTLSDSPRSYASATCGRCSIRVLDAVRPRGGAAGVPEERQIRFRIGINLGGVIVEGHEISAQL